MKTKLALLSIALALLTVGYLRADDNPTKPCCINSLTPASGSFSEKSLYQVESQWTNDAGKTLRLGELKGRPQIVAMFFANCQYACPAIVHDMMRMVDALPKNLRTNLGLTLVTFDPNRDTPAVLADYRRARNLPADRWTLLQGSSDNILELAALLGVRYKQNASGQFDHSNLITILNADGEIVHQQSGLNQDIRESTRILESLLK